MNKDIFNFDLERTIEIEGQTFMFKKRVPFGVLEDIEEKAKSGDMGIKDIYDHLQAILIPPPSREICRTVDALLYTYIMHEFGEFREQLQDELKKKLQK